MKENDEQKTELEDNSIDTSDCENQSRRDALKKLGKFAAYTAPAMYAIAVSKSAAAS